MKTMLILLLLSNGEWHYTEREAAKCERIASSVRERLRQNPSIEEAFIACTTRYEA